MVCYVVFPKTHPNPKYIHLQNCNEPDPLPVPWKSVATSVPFAALVLTDMAACFGAFTFMTNWPTYLKFMLGFDIKTNGLLSALPFICRSLLMAVLKQNNRVVEVTF